MRHSISSKRRNRSFSLNEKAYGYGGYVGIYACGLLKPRSREQFARLNRMRQEHSSAVRNQTSVPVCTIGSSLE